MLQQKKIREIKGIILKIIDDKSLVVEVSKNLIHKKYKKPIILRRKMLVHNNIFEPSKLIVKSKVSIINSKSFSKTKKFLLFNIF